MMCLALCVLLIGVAFCEADSIFGELRPQITGISGTGSLLGKLVLRVQTIHSLDINYFHEVQNVKLMK